MLRRMLPGMLVDLWSADRPVLNVGKRPTRNIPARAPHPLDALPRNTLQAARNPKRRVIMKRRKFLQYTAATGLGLLGSGLGFGARASAEPGALPGTTGTAGAHTPAPHMPLHIPGDSGLLGMLDITTEHLTLDAHNTTLRLRQNTPSPFQVWSAKYAGKDYQNPIIRIKTGQHFNARLQNNLNEPNIIHWHGLHIPGDMDGQPRSMIDPGGHFDYAFDVPNRSGMYWYHSHAHHHTAQQVYFGLAGIYMVEDEDERALRNALQIEPGLNEIPLIIQDRQFNSAGELTYAFNPMQHHMGQLGDTILVNLTPHPKLEITNRLYRFRVLNGSNSRIYKLAFVHGDKMLPYSIIGTDAGLLERAHVTQQEYISPGERLDIVFDASQLRAGDEVYLKSLAFDPLEGGTMLGMGELMGGVSGWGGTEGARLDLGAEFEIMKIAVTRESPARPSGMIPPKLSTIARIDTGGAVRRDVRLTVRRMLWLINGETFTPDRYPLQSRSNTIELWDIQNAEMSMPHPMHMHGFSFQVVQRSNSPSQVRALAQDENGRLITDLGWKDTILVWPGETVRIATDFTHPYKGDQIYLFHCHNLEHEDQGMMVNHLVTAA